MKDRIKKVNQLIKKEFFRIIVREIEFPADVYVTLTRVETSVDLRQGRVYISVMPENRVKDILKAEVANELQELLKIDDKAFRNFFSQLLSDEKTWMTILTILHGLRTGGEVITAGAALYGLSKIGATIFKELSERNNTLSTSSYTLIYRMS